MSNARKLLLLSKQPLAKRLLGAEQSGLAISFIDGSMLVRDLTTAANNFFGKYTDKLTIVGALPWSSDGALIDNSNYASLATNLFPYADGAAGTIVVSFKIPGTPANPYIYAFSDGSANNRIASFGGTTAAQVSHRVTSGGVGSVSGVGGAVGTTNRQTLAVAFDTNDFQAYFLGSAAFNDTSVTLPTGITRLSIGRNEALSGNPLVGQAYSLVYVPRRMTNGELAAASA